MNFAIALRDSVTCSACEIIKKTSGRDSCSSCNTRCASRTSTGNVPKEPVEEKSD